MTQMIVVDSSYFHLIIIVSKVWWFAIIKHFVEILAFFVVGR